MVNDRQLLQRYSETLDEQAFGELVRRHLDFVYCSALRQIGDRQLAEDVAQQVFTDLARKAANLSGESTLIGWLHQATRYASARVRRSEQRRIVREQQALTMHTTEQPQSDHEWEGLCGLIDETLDELPQLERIALLLRFFEQQNFAEVGQALGTNADAARKRVERALDRLREKFARRGIFTTTAALSTSLAAHALQTAPHGLAATLTSAALLSAVPSTSIGISTLTMIASTSTKVVLGIAAIATGLLITSALQEKALANARAEQRDLMFRLTRSSSGVEAIALDVAPSPASSIRRKELLQLRGEVAGLRSQLEALKQRRAALQASAKPGTKLLGETIHLSELRDVGQATPSALLQTRLLAILQGDTNRLAALMVWDTRKDLADVKRMFEGIRKASLKGYTNMLNELPFNEFRLISETSAGNGDCWVAYQIVMKDGTENPLQRIRIRSTDSGWKLVDEGLAQEDDRALNNQP